MPPAPTFVYQAPAAPARRRVGGRRPVARWAGVPLAAALLVVPFVPTRHGDTASLAAGARLAFKRSTHAPISRSLPDELAPTGGFVLEPAQPFVLQYGDRNSALRAETCLTEAIYYEGALETEAGQRAIAQVVLNRVRHPAYPHSVCGVVFEGQERATGCQFTFTCDGSRARPPVPSLWRRANAVARAALAGAVAPEVGLSTHYHADYVMPYWSATLSRTGRIGRHLFYRWRGGAGEAAAFSARYAGFEPEIPKWVTRALPPTTDEMTTAADLSGARGAGLAGAVNSQTEERPAPETPPPAPETKPFRARPLTLIRKADGPI